MITNARDRLPRRPAAVALALGISLITGCGGLPERNAALEDARDRYATAERNPDVATRAPVELKAAGQAFTRAESAWREREDPRTVEHLAYLARQQAAIAVEIARLRMAEADIAQASSERDRVLLAARTREAEAARRAAQEAEGRAQQAQMSAEQRRQLAAAEQRRAEEAAQRAEAERLRAEESQRQAALAQQQAAASQQAVQEAQARSRELESRLQELQARKTERGMVVTLGDVLFDVGKADLKPGAMRTVRRLAEFLQRYPEYRVAIEGFTDSTGSDELNRRLSEQRAIAVRLALTDMGIGPERSTARGYGEAFPVASNGNAAGRQLNRRVEIVISDEKGSFPAGTERTATAR